MNGSSTAKFNIGEFYRQTRQEIAKVTWPTRKETLVTTGMVFAMTILAAIFFFLVDQVMAEGVRLVFGLGI
jgi:preprotein translocase subunit SecE